MIIPSNVAFVQHFFEGVGMPNGAAVTYATFRQGADSPVQMATDLHDAWTDTMRPSYATTVSMVATRVKYGPNATGPFGTFAAPIAGTASGPQSPPNVAILVEKHTEMGGRGGHGRFYLPGVLEAWAEADGRLLPAGHTVVTSCVVALLDAVQVIGNEMLLLHTSSSDPTTVTELTVDPILATQRRRLRG